MSIALASPSPAKYQRGRSLRSVAAQARTGTTLKLYASASVAAFHQQVDTANSAAPTHAIYELPDMRRAMPKKIPTPTAQDTALAICNAVSARTVKPKERGTT